MKLSAYQHDFIEEIKMSETVKRQKTKKRVIRSKRSPTAELDEVE